jgi:hypothetical protein
MIENNTTDLVGINWTVQAEIENSATPPVTAPQGEFPDSGFRGERGTYMLSVASMQLKRHPYEKMAPPTENG